MIYIPRCMFVKALKNKDDLNKLVVKLDLCDGPGDYEVTSCHHKIKCKPLSNKSINELFTRITEIRTGKKV